MNPEFWKNKNVLITGHTGFKGSWLSLWLQNLGANVCGYALPVPTQPSLFETANVANGMHSVEGDVRDLDGLKKLVKVRQPEIIVHMAAQALVRYSYDSPVETYATNVMGTVNLLEATRHADSVRVVLNITSDKCYENKEWLWAYRENEPMGGHDPYSSSKGCAELVTEAYRKSYFSNDANQCVVASARAGNVIGGGDWATDRLIPDIIRAFTQASTVVIRSPDAIRPWQHVLEPLNGYLTLVEKLWQHGQEYAEGWNFGPGEQGAMPVEWMVRKMMAAWGEGASYELDPQPQVHEANYLKLDSSRAHSLLGWAPKLDLSQALQWLTEWYKVCQQGEDMRTYTLSQIDAYQNLDVR